MNIFEEGLSIYNSFSTLTLVIIWVSIFFFCFLIFNLYKLKKKNIELTQKIEELTKQEQLLKKKILQSKSQSEKSEKNVSDKKTVINNTKTPPQEELQVSSNSKAIPPKGKEPLNAINRNQTSSVYLSEKKPSSSSANPNLVTIKSKDGTKLKQNSMNLNDFIKKGKKDSPKKHSSQESDVISVKQLPRKSQEEDHSIPKTDFEKKQEENAIISYHEFLQVKDKLYEEADDDEDLNFIKDLKQFREELEKKVNS